LVVKNLVLLPPMSKAGIFEGRVEDPVLRESKTVGSAVAPCMVSRKFKCQRPQNAGEGWEHIPGKEHHGSRVLIEKACCVCHLGLVL